MIFTPHILQMYIPGSSSQNEEGHMVTSPGSWVELCACRCDDNNTDKKVGVGGEGIVYSYHVVFDKREKLSVGTKVRVLNQDATVRAEGNVIMAKQANMLNYSEIYLQ